MLLKHQAETTIAKLAEQESWRVHDQLVKVLETNESSNRTDLAESALNQMVGGMFDWVELHQLSGTTIAEVKTDVGVKIEKEIAPHNQFTAINNETFIDSNSTSSVIRIFVPIFKNKNHRSDELLGYLEIGRNVPEWRKRQIQDVVLYISLITAFTALITGLLIYPSILLLLRRQKENLQKLFDSHVQVLDSLGVAISKRESGTGTHNYKVTWIATILGEKWGYHLLRLRI